MRGIEETAQELTAQRIATLMEGYLVTTLLDTSLSTEARKANLNRGFQKMKTDGAKLVRTSVA